jgi:hypothetical protein
MVAAGWRRAASSGSAFEGTLNGCAMRALSGAPARRARCAADANPALRQVNIDGLFVPSTRVCVAAGDLAGDPSVDDLARPPRSGSPPVASCSRDGRCPWSFAATMSVTSVSR